MFLSTFSSNLTPQNLFKNLISPKTVEALLMVVPSILWLHRGNPHRRRPPLLHREMLPRSRLREKNGPAARLWVAFPLILGSQADHSKNRLPWNCWWNKSLLRSMGLFEKAMYDYLMVFGLPAHRRSSWEDDRPKRNVAFQFLPFFWGESYEAAAFLEEKHGGNPSPVLFLRGWMVDSYCTCLLFLWQI